MQKVHDNPENRREKDDALEKGYQLSLLSDGPFGEEDGKKVSGSSMEEEGEAIEMVGRGKSAMNGGRGGEGEEVPAQCCDWNNPMGTVEHLQDICWHFVSKNWHFMRWLLWAALLLLYHVFLVSAILHDFQKAVNLLVITLLAWLYLFNKGVLSPFLRRSKQLERHRKKFVDIYGPLWKSGAVRKCFYVLAIGLPLLYVLWDTRSNRQRLSGLTGLLFFLIFMVLCSHRPSKVKLRPVFWGFLLQFIFGILVLKWEWGAQRFIDLSNLAITFLDFTKNGTDFTYGFLSSPPNICGMEPVIAFQVIQVILYVGAIVSVLYFYGIVQAVLKKMAWLMQLTLGTTATESLNACACVLLGNAESPLLIRPYIEKMTASELHAIMTTGFACIAGAVFAAYISFGACPRYLLSAAVMSAPGSLACSKLLYPETEKSHVKDVKELELPPSKEANAMECISSGSILSVQLVSAVVANLVAFMALMALLDGIVGYIGSMVGFPHWNLELFFGYAFFPVAYLIGVTEDVQETLVVARLIGVKIVINDFVAYKRLGDALREDLLSPRAAMITTYALCSFSDFIAAGIQMAVLSEMAPSKKRLISKLVLRALLAGCISCFMSAAIAGILIDEPVACRPKAGMGGKCFDLVVHQEFMERMMNGTNASHLLTSNSTLKVEL